MKRRMTWSATGNRTEATATMTNTMMVVMVVSLRVGQVTLSVSERTSCHELERAELGHLLN